MTRLLCSCVVAMLLTGAAACSPRVVHVCPPSRQTCSVAGPKARDRPSPPRSPIALFGLASPRSFGMPHALERPRSLALDPGGELLALADQWGELLVLRVRDGQVRQRLGLSEELDDGLRLTFTRNGLYLVTAGHGQRRVKLWSVSSGRVVREQQVGGHPIRGVAPGQGTEVLLATGQGAEVWDLGSGQRRHLAKMPYDLPVARVAGSNRGLWAAGDQAGNVRIFSTSAPGTGGLLPSPGKRLVALSLSADGSLLATGFDDGLVRLHDTAALSDRRGFRFYAQSAIVGLGLTRMGTQVAVAEESGKITCLDAQGGRVLASLQATAKGARALDVALSDGGTRLALVSSDRRVTLLQGMADERQVQLPKEHRPPLPRRPKPTLHLLQPARIDLEIPGTTISSFSLGLRGQFLAVGGQPSLVAVYYLDYRPAGGAAPLARRLYLRSSPTSGAKPGREPVWAAISPDRRWLLAQGGGFSLHRWALISGRAIPTNSKPAPSLRGLLPTPDGESVISLAGADVLGRAPGGTEHFRFPGIPEAYWMGATEPPTRLIMIRGWDRLAAFDPPMGALRWAHESGLLADYEVLAVALPMKTRTLITYHANGFLRRYHVDTGALLDRSRIPTPEGVQRCALRPDGRVLACGHPGGIDLFEVPGGALLGSLPPPLPRERDNFRALDLAFSPRGNVLAVRTARSRLAVYSFDHPDEVERFTGVEAEARIRLGLPITPPPLKDRPSALYRHPRLAPQGPLRRDRPSSPDPGGSHRAPSPPVPPRP